MSQNTDDGRVMVAQTAHKHGISYEMASINCSKIEFRVDVEQCYLYKSIDISGTKIKLFVKTPANKTIGIDIGLNNTIYDLKALIHDKEEIPPQLQRLIFECKLLENWRKLADYNIKNECSVHLFLSLRGGGCYERSPLNELNDDTDDSSNDSFCTGDTNLSNRYTDVADKSSSSLQLFSGERGVVCYGKRSDQQFSTYDDFKKDWDISVNSFVIEMRMQSRYAPI